MRKKIKWTFIILILLALGGSLGVYSWKTQTKSHSSEATVAFKKGTLQVEVYYNRPSKKGRQIFGNLVPYGEVWRTGANEATTFETNKPLYVDGSILKAGKYTLWTIPGEQSWKVIFNKKMYLWGVNPTTGEVMREPEFDVLQLEVPVMKTLHPTEQFTIRFEENPALNDMFLSWDDVSMKVPFKKLEH